MLPYCKSLGICLVISDTLRGCDNIALCKTVAGVVIGGQDQLARDP